MPLYDSTDRKPAEYVIFAAGFAGFLLASTGIVLTSIALAVFGGFLLIGSVACFLVGA